MFYPRKMGTALANDSRYSLERAEISAVDVNINGARSNSSADFYNKLLGRQIFSSSSRNNSRFRNVCRAGIAGQRSIGHDFCAGASRTRPDGKSAAGNVCACIGDNNVGYVIRRAVNDVKSSRIASGSE